MQPRWMLHGAIAIMSCPQLHHLQYMAQLEAAWLLQQAPGNPKRVDLQLELTVHCPGLLPDCTGPTQRGSWTWGSEK
jgi:hypothetical protein